MPKGNPNQSFTEWLYQKEVDELGKAFDLLNDQVVILDRNAVLRYVNSAMSKKSGFTKEECVGKNPRELWGGRMPKDFYGELWYTVKQEKRHFVGEINNKRKDGSEYTEELHISPVLDSKNEAKYFIGIAFDMSNRKTSAGHELRNIVDEAENGSGA